MPQTAAEWIIHGPGWLVFLYLAVTQCPAAISYEDNKLERIFGDEWREWSGNIRAIIPGKYRWQDLKTGGWDTYQSLIRNGELPISLYLLSCGIWLWVVSHSL